MAALRHRPQQENDRVKTVLISVQRNLDILGLKMLHHLLLDAGRASFLLYLPDWDDEKTADSDALEGFIREKDPGLIGLSLMAIDYPYAIQVTARIRSAFPDIPVVWGGIHPTTSPEMCLEHAPWLCIGEGEITLPELVRTLEAGGSPGSVAGMAWMEAGALRRNAMPPLLTDLDRLPIMRQIAPESHILRPEGIVPLTKAHLIRGKRYRGGVYKILTSRGCPHACAYCVNSFLQRLYESPGIRRRSTEHVMRELELAIREGPPLEYVDFSDDCFLAGSLERIREFAAACKARIGRPFIAKGTPHYFTREKMDVLTDAGLAWVNIGLQSGSDRVCGEVYNRKITARSFLEAAALVNEYPVAVYYDVIVDNPFETREESLETAEVLLQTPRPFYTLMFSLSVYAGTALYDRAAEEEPDLITASLAKDYRKLGNDPVIRLIDMAGVMPRPLVRRLMAWYRVRPESLAVKIAIGISDLFCQFLFKPLTWFRLIVRSQHGNLWKALRVLPVYFRDGLNYYLNSFIFMK
jgi:anaerobic magnesium-protoporphyrin IX monomethyl ester cyclase